MIDTTFNMQSDANGGDPDATSPTLRRYHKLLWSKPLPCGTMFDLRDDDGHYLRHRSALGTFSLGSDSITHSYRNQVSKRWLTTQIPDEVQELFDLGSTIGAFLVFPNKQVDRKPTINQARGVSRLIDDRFDLTLECIRRFFVNEASPLSETLERYADFFRLFGTFDGYIRFFLLDDLLDDRRAIKFHLPFDGFRSPPQFNGVADYCAYKRNVEAFVNARNQRISDGVLAAIQN